MCKQKLFCSLCKVPLESGILLLAYVHSMINIGYGVIFITILVDSYWGRHIKNLTPLYVLQSFVVNILCVLPRTVSLWISQLWWINPPTLGAIYVTTHLIYSLMLGV